MLASADGAGLSDFDGEASAAADPDGDGPIWMGNPWPM
jgi:hypothetical protein